MLFFQIISFIFFTIFPPSFFLFFSQPNLAPSNNLTKKELKIIINMFKPRFFTGIQATGTLTLGNYCGLIHHILKIQNDYEVIIMIADLHALTVPKKELDYREKC